MTDDENARALSGRAMLLLKEGKFSIDMWSDIIDIAGSNPLAGLVVALRNALCYGKETGAIRGIVKSGYNRAVSDWKTARHDMPKDMADAGDKALSIAEEYIRKEKIRIE